METHQESPRSVAEEDHKSITRKRSIATALDAAAHETCASGPVTKLPHLAPNLLPQYAEWTEWLKHRTVVFDINNQQPNMKGSFVKSYAGHSVQGYNPGNKDKQNQDSLIMFEDAATKSVIVACLDGHGANGHKISQLFKREIESRLCAHPLFAEQVEVAISDVLALVEYDIYRREARLADYSGTTLTLAVIRGRRVTVANVGDSRIIVGKCVSGGSNAAPCPTENKTYGGLDAKVHGSASSCNTREYLRPQPLTMDHKPDVATEHARILASGGRVFSVRYEDGVVGPPRVWLGNMNIPGLAMSRSLGDFVVHTAGVISRPDFVQYELQPGEDAYLIAATDGLWDFVHNAEAIHIVHQYPQEPSRAVEALIQTAQWRWFQRERVVDDITLAVLHFHRHDIGNNCDNGSRDKENRKAVDVQGHRLGTRDSDAEDEEVVDGERERQDSHDSAQSTVLSVTDWAAAVRLSDTSTEEES